MSALHFFPFAVGSRDSKNDIVRTLVSMMMSKVGAKPTRGQCEQVARDLILKYPFMKDDIGDGYVSIVYMQLICV